MTDRLLGPRFIVATRVGRTNLGDATVLLDETVISVKVHEAETDQPMRVPLTTIDLVEFREREVELTLRDGSIITFVTTTASADLHGEILGRCQALPELTHALRAFGSRRGHRSIRATAAADQRRFFAPLLEARRQAVAAASSPAALAAFDADVLIGAVTTELRKFAEERYGENAPARRALEAELLDLSEPLQEQLALLRDLARDANASSGDLRPWRAWTRQLGATFECADRVWLSLDAALDANPWKP